MHKSLPYGQKNNKQIKPQLFFTKKFLKKKNDWIASFFFLNF